MALAEQPARSARVSSPRPRDLPITRSKRATYELLADVIPVPHVFAAPQDVGQFPVFAKPDRSQGSQGAVLVPDAAALTAALAGGSTS